MAHADRTQPAHQVTTGPPGRHLHVVPDPEEERRRHLAAGIEQIRAIRAQLAARSTRRGS